MCDSRKKNTQWGGCDAPKEKLPPSTRPLPPLNEPKASNWSKWFGGWGQQGEMSKGQFPKLPETDIKSMDSKCPGGKCGPRK